MANQRFITCFKCGAWKWVGWVLLLSLAACGVAEQRIAGDVATPPAVPPATSSTREDAMGESTYEHTLASVASAGTPPSSSSAKLESLLFQAGDLPGTIVDEPADDPTPPNFASQAPPTTLVGRRLARDRRAAGSVSLLLYSNPSDLAQAYARLTANVDPFTAQPRAMEPRTDVGDTAVTGRVTLASSTYGPTHIAVVIFARCHAIVDIRLNEQPDLSLDTAVAYAKRVDQRIVASVCQ